MKAHSSAVALLTITPLVHSFCTQFALRPQHTTGIVSFNSPTILDAISKEQIGVIDGSNFNTLDLFSAAEGNSSAKGNSFDGEKIGIVKLIVGTLNDENPKDRIIGIVANPDEVMDDETVSIRSGGANDMLLYKDSIASVPITVSDEDAISTSFAALTGVHCAYHDPIRKDDNVVTGIGGGEDSFKLSKNDKVHEKVKRKVIVLGGGEYAIFMTDSLASLGGDVTQITTNKSVKPRNQLNVSISPPGIGDEEFSFSSVMNFDVLVDSLSDEAKLGEASCRGLADDNAGEVCSSAVIKLLQKQNRCKRYISTVTLSQKKVQDDGIIWGRSKAIKFGKDVVEKVSNSRSLCSSSSIAPPKKFGEKTLQPLLNAGIVYKSKSKEEVFTQGWNVQDFWEQVSWPRDADGGNIRFGFPVVADLDSLEEDNDEREEEESRMISAPPTLVSDAQVPKISRDELAGKDNPYVLDIKGLKDLNHEILGPKKDCIIFLSASYCRTCRYLAPQYTKLARKYADAGNDITFAKSNASGKIGKEVSRALGVDAVPAFCFFKAGRRYGSVVSVSRMPSKKLDAALNLLVSGADWDKPMINSLK